MSGSEEVDFGGIEISVVEPKHKRREQVVSSAVIDPKAQKRVPELWVSAEEIHEELSRRGRERPGGR